MASEDVASRFDRIFAATELERQPWRFAYMEDLLSPQTCLALLQAFPSAPLAPCERKSAQKSYQLLTCPLKGADLTDGPARDLVAYLEGPRYRELMAAFTGLRLEGCDVSLDLWEYRAGHWLGPHVDKPGKRVTQILYLTPNWRPGDGGRLIVLQSADPGSVAAALAPRFGGAAIVVRSEDSWHAVERIAPDAASRRSLTVTFRDHPPLS